MSLTEGEIMDLGKLAVSRCERAFNSVAQLIDDDHLNYSLMIAVSCSFLEAAAKLMQHGVEKQDGERPGDDEVRRRVMFDMLQAMGFENNGSLSSRGHAAQGNQPAGQG